MKNGNQLGKFRTKFALTKLIALTNERDVNALELLLAQAIFDLIQPSAVGFYRLLDAHEGRFLTTLIGREEVGNEITGDLRKTLLSCVETGLSIQSFGADGVLATFYPLKGQKNETVAVITLERPKNVVDLHEIMEMVLQIYRNLVMLINDNERDTLTGLLNRKTFEQKISKVFLAMLSEHDRKNESIEKKYFLAIFDIDHFKRVNDEYGHLMGDEVLLMFSQLMTKAFRDKDLLFRFGGEEFLAVFECAKADDMQCALDRFKEQVGHFSFPQVGKVTVSAGYTEVSQDYTSTQLIDRADAALYFAKNNGRNRISLYEYLVENGDLQEIVKEGEIELF